MQSCRRGGLWFVDRPGGAHEAGEAPVVVVPRHAAQQPQAGAVNRQRGFQVQMGEGLLRVQAVVQRSTIGIVIEQSACGACRLARRLPTPQAVLGIGLPLPGILQVSLVAQLGARLAQCAFALATSALRAQREEAGSHQHQGQ